MKLIHITIIAILLPLFTSCNIANNISYGTLITLFAVLLALFALMFYLIIKRRRQADKSLVKFSISIQEMLKKFDSPEKKIIALHLLVKRIKVDEKYQKDTQWRDQVLAKTYLYIATQYHEIGDMENTLSTCSDILDINPDDAMTLYNRGSIYSNKQMYPEALEDINRSIELVPDYASSYNNRGTIYSRTGKLEEALVEFTKGLELETSAITYYNRASVFTDLNRNEEALLDYKTCLDVCTEYDDELKSEVQNIITKLEHSTND